MDRKHLFLTLLVIAAVLLVGCSSAPDAREAQVEETEQEAPETASQQTESQADQEEDVAAVTEQDSQEASQEEVAAADTSAQASIPTRWRAVSARATYNGRPYQIPEEFLNYPVYGSLRGDTLRIEVPEIGFRIIGTYSREGNGLYKVTPTQYANVPERVLEVAQLARRELGSGLPSSYYFSVSRNGRNAVIEAKALDFTLESRWVPVE